MLRAGAVCRVWTSAVGFGLGGKHSTSSKETGGKWAALRPRQEYSSSRPGSKLIQNSANGVVHTTLWGFLHWKQ